MVRVGAMAVVPPADSVVAGAVCGMLSATREDRVVVEEEAVDGLVSDAARGWAVFLSLGLAAGWATWSTVRGGRGNSCGR